jgi:hypothetical protein
MSAYASVTSVGGLLPTSLLERVRAGDTKIPGTTPESYGLVPGERIGDHVTRSWNRLRGVWESFTTQLALLPESDRATTLTRERWCRPLLDELGFAGLPAASGLSVDGKAYPISHEWGDTVPVHVMGARLTIDRRAAGVAGAAAMSPHGSGAGVPQPFRRPPVGNRHERPRPPGASRQRIAHQAGLRRVRPRSDVRRRPVQRLRGAVAHLPPHTVRR